jgi:hypothetical protein
MRAKTIDGFVVRVLLPVAIVRPSSLPDRSETLERVLANRSGTPLPPTRGMAADATAKYLRSKPRTRAVTGEESSQIGCRRYRRMLASNSPTDPPALR